MTFYFKQRTFMMPSFTRLSASLFIYFGFFLHFLRSEFTFRGATDTPVLDFWWHLSWVSKSGWISHLCAFSLVWSSDSPLVWHLMTVKKVSMAAGPFCGATDAPVLDFWWHLSWDSKPGWIPFPISNLTMDIYDFLFFPVFPFLGFPRQQLKNLLMTSMNYSGGSRGRRMRASP